MVVRLMYMMFWMGFFCATLAQQWIVGTHDSGAYQLGSHIQPEYDDLPSWLWNLQEKIEQRFPGGYTLRDLALRWATTQSITIRDQLEKGARYLDVRCGWNGTHWNLFHYRIGTSCENAIIQIRDFLKVESVPFHLYVKIGHLDGRRLKGYTVALRRLLMLINNRLTPWLQPHRRRRVIVGLDTTKEEWESFPNEVRGEVVLGSDAFLTTYADTTHPLRMITYNKNLLRKLNEPDPRLVKGQKLVVAAWTLTPQPWFVLEQSGKNSSLLELASQVNAMFCAFHTWVSQKKFRSVPIFIFDNFHGVPSCLSRVEPRTQQDRQVQESKNREKQMTVI